MEQQCGHSGRIGLNILGAIVGWFSIAVIVGFLLFWSWRHHLRKVSGGVAGRYSSMVGNAHHVFVDFLPAILFILVIVCVGLWLFGKRFVLVDSFNTWVLEDIRGGYITRFVLGLILGFGAGFVLEQRSRPADEEAGKSVAGESSTAPAAIPPAPKVETDSKDETVRSIPAGVVAPGPIVEDAPPLGPGATALMAAADGASSRGAESRISTQSTDAANGSRVDGDKRTAEGAPSPLSSLARLSTNALLSIAIGMFVLALASPHLDSWLSHLTKITLPYGELTVATTTAHRTINSDALLYLADALSLNALSKYKDKLRQDIGYIKHFEIPELELNMKAAQSVSDRPQDLWEIEKKLTQARTTLEKVEALQPAFNKLISPIAGCVLDAIDNGLSVETVRRKLRPAAEDLEEIIFAGDHLTKGERTNRHQDFWTTIESIPEYVSKHLDGPNKDTASDRKDECLSYPIGAADVTPPKLEDYRSVPYLAVAAFLFSAFVKDEDLAQKIFDKIADGLKYKDKEFLYYQSYIGYYKGLPADVIISHLEQYLSDARNHKNTIQRAKDQCLALPPCKPERWALMRELYKRERNAELRAVNDLAYYIGDSNARGVPAALGYQGRAEDYVAELHRSLDDDGDIDDKNEFRDTYAYVSIVLEARKANPDVAKFKSMLVLLKKVSEYFENAAARSTKIEDAVTRYNLDLVRSHLTAARELAEE